MVLAAKVGGCQVVAEREGPYRGPLGCSAQEDFAAFFKRHRGVVFRTILAKTMDAAAAEDATAEAFACAYAHWDDTVAGHANPEAWVLKVAWNQHLSWWRAWGSRRAAEAPAPRWPAAPPPVDPRVVAAIRGLPRGQRDAFVLAALGGLPPTQVAAVLGKAPGTVRAQLHRARARLRLVLGERPSPEGRDD
jgi:DNA-directed RNA polymerase specialized sigma24 family protein